MIAIRAEATSTVMEERARIARELHDGLLQDAMTIALHLRAVLPDVRAASESAARALLPIVELAEQTTAEARRDIMGIRAIAPDERLVDALERTIRRATIRTSLVTSTAVFGRVRSVPAPVQDAVLRIVREAATNIMRHARARTIRLAVAFASRRLRVTIDDDGQGFDTHRGDSTGHHFGLIGMHERAALVGGSVDVRSRVGMGTTVTLTVPLHFAHHHQMELPCLPI